MTRAPLLGVVELVLGVPVVVLVAPFTAAELVISPNVVGLAMFRLGLPKFSWLNAL